MPVNLHVSPAASISDSAKESLQPFAALSSPSHSEEQAPSAPIMASILIVDDRPENLLALEAILDAPGIDLVRAASGPEALRHVLRQDFAVILMDVQMPGMDGFQTTVLIKERERSRHIPIIFVTAISTDERYVFQGYSTGAVDYIAKPFNVDILKSKVAVFVDLFRKTEQIKHQADLLRLNEQREKHHEMLELERALERRHMAEMQESRISLARFKETLDTALDSIFLFDARTLRFSYANQGAINQLGYSCEELFEMTPLDIQADFDEPQYREMMRPLLEGEVASLTQEAIHTHRDGHIIPVETFLQYIAPPSVAPPGELGGFVAIVRDITERRKMERSLIVAKEEAERANRAKSEFISGVSHELRTPLNAIVGFSKLLLNPRVGPLNEDQTIYTTDIVQGAEHLLHLINDILDLSKIEAGKLDLELSTFVLCDLLDASLTIVREKAKVHELALESVLSDEVRALPPVVADARKVRQILYNLLSNAVKFTPDGGSITLTAQLALHSEKPEEAELIVSVSDTGIGIAPDHQARVFGAFEQVDSSYARRQDGTGLGLALTKRMVELHGGKLWLESEEGHGSTFSFSLPLRFEEEAIEDDEKELAPGGDDEIPENS